MKHSHSLVASVILSLLSIVALFVVTSAPTAKEPAAKNDVEIELQCRKTPTV